MAFSCRALLFLVCLVTAAGTQQCQKGCSKVSSLALLQTHRVSSKVELATEGAVIRSGDTILLRVARTGHRVTAQEDGSVHAKWDHTGTWQQFVVEKEAGGGDVQSGDAVFLSAWTGKHITVGGYQESGSLDRTAVHAKWSHKGQWQKLTINKKGETGPIMAGDEIFLQAWTEAQIDADAPDSAGIVQARWNHQGDWQKLVIEVKAPATSVAAPTTPAPTPAPTTTPPATTSPPVTTSSAQAPTAEPEPEPLLPPRPFSFRANTSSHLAFGASDGAKATITGLLATECQADLVQDEALDDLLLVKRKHGDGNCYRTHAYSNANYEVDRGTVADTFPAYRVHPAQHHADRFVAGGTEIYYRFPEKRDYVVYTLEDGHLVQFGQVLADSVAIGEFVKTGVYVNAITSPRAYVFLPLGMAVPAPAARTLSGEHATECDMSNIDGAALGDVAVVTVARSGTCWTGGNYNSRDYLVESGTFSGGSSGVSLPAYRIHPAADPSVKWDHSGTHLYLRVPQPWEHSITVWQLLDSGDAAPVATVSGASSTPEGGFVDTGIRVNDLTSPAVFAFVAAGTVLSTWMPLSATADGAYLAGGEGFSVTARRFRLAGDPRPHPFLPGSDWSYGPDTHQAGYGTPKKFFPTVRSDGREGVIWQDQETFVVHATWLSLDMAAAETQTVYAGTDSHLVAVAFSGADELMMLLVGRGEQSSQGIPVQVIKVACMTGETLATKVLDTSSSALAVAKYSSSGASMAWNSQTGVVGVLLARTMQNGHQGARAFVLDATSLEIQRSFQTASHSFSNSMILASDGSFISMDLGDNYPRGILLTRFDSSSKSSFQPYAVKTRHATGPKDSGEGNQEYTEISTPEVTYYKWSNDNYVYTELGHEGVVEVDDGLLVFFSGERPALDNAAVGKSFNAARNVGFVKIGKDLSAREVLSPGAVETGGFFTYGGGWKAQEHRGINYLTDFDSVESSASRLKTAAVGEGKILLYWEVWGPKAYKYTQMMLVDRDGLGASPWTLNYTTIPSPVQLPIQDDLLVRGGRAVAYAGAPDGVLMRYEFAAP